MEQRASRRAEKFIEITNDYQAKSQQSLDDLLNKVYGIDDSLARMNAASEQVRAYVTWCAKYANRAAQLFLGSVVTAVLIVAGTLWWSHHIVNGLAQDKVDLAALDSKLKHTPVILHFKGKDYVRVMPDSETGFTRGDGSEVPGRYAQIWHLRL